MNRKSRLLLSVLSALFLMTGFSSCVDYVQTISYKDGKYELYYKITVSKVVLALGGSSSDNTYEVDESIIAEFPKNSIVTKVDSDLESGAEIRCSINPKAQDEMDKQFVPKATKTKIYIPFYLGKQVQKDETTVSKSSSESDAMAQAFFSSSKCRIIISKKVLPSYKSIYFEGINTENYQLEVYDYGETYCVEIPFALLLQNGMYRFERIVVLKSENVL